MLNGIKSQTERAMATTFVIACPDCGKQVKVSDEHVGKRVKCKECGTVYPVKAPAAKGPPPAPGKPKATKAQAGKGTRVKPPPPPTKAEAPEAPAEVEPAGYRYVEDDEDPNAPKQYTVQQDESTLPRCPFCAVEMESAEALICLNCGYNTRTRQRPEVRQVYAPTAMEWFLWWLPAILCILIMIGMLVWYIIFWMRIEGWMADSWFEDEPGPPRTFLGGLGPGFMRLYLGLFTAFCYVPLIRFVVKRLIKNPRPPERKIKEEMY